MLIDAGADVDETNDDSDTPLHIACLYLQPDGVRTLLRRDADETLCNDDFDAPGDIVGHHVSEDKRDEEVVEWIREVCLNRNTHICLEEMFNPCILSFSVFVCVCVCVCVCVVFCAEEFPGRKHAFSCVLFFRHETLGRASGVAPSVVWARCCCCDARCQQRVVAGLQAQE